MSRVTTLATFQLKEFVRSLAIAAPLAITVALYWIFFEFPGDVDYFCATGGFVLLVVALVTTLLLAGQSNRMSNTAAATRLPHRSELLAAIMASALTVTAAMGLVYTGLAFGQAKVALSAVNLIVIAPRWLALTGLSAAIGLHLTRLVDRNGSHLIAFVLLALFATIVEQQGVLMRSDLAWLAQAAAAISSPVFAVLRDPVAPLALGRYGYALAVMAVYTIGLFLLAAWLFRRKDLLWVD